MKEILFIFCITAVSASAQEFKLQNPVTETWLISHLRKESPRVILTWDILQAIKKEVVADPVAKAYYQYLYKNAEAMINLPVLERQMIGRRLLMVSREAAKRIGTLAIVYAVSGEKRFLTRTNAEIVALCNFSDWNPSHFLDVAEAAYAVAIGLDWTLGDLPAETKKMAVASLVEKAIKPSLITENNSWISGHNNWNQVCHGGLSVAAVAIASDYPALAATVISRALENIPHALSSYAPDGAYPEGASYWEYGTSYTLLTISVFESAFGTDFGIAKAPGFLESAVFVKVLAGPSGEYFNYFDSSSGGDNSLDNLELLSWFSQKADNARYVNKSKFLQAIGEETTDGKHVSKMNGAALTWIVGNKATNTAPLPTNWKGDGRNPIAILRSAETKKSKFFLGAKGGSASQSHGNMDAGSFVFELNGVRWSVDPGNQDYTALEAILGTGGLWNTAQSSPRWTLLTKNNFGHGTLTVNDSLHKTNGFAPMVSFEGDSMTPEVEFDLSHVFGDQLASAHRKFIKVSDQTLRIEDEIGISPRTVEVTWAMMTTANVESTPNGAVLRQDGQTLTVKFIGFAKMEPRIKSLDPPALPYDKKIPGLKRIEFHIPVELLQQVNSKIVVELTGDNAP